MKCIGPMSCRRRSRAGPSRGTFPTHWSGIRRGAADWDCCLRPSIPAHSFGGAYVTLVPLVPAGYLLYVGARFFAQILDQPRREAFEKKLRAQNLSLVERSKATASFTTDTPTLIDELLDSVVADIPNYMRSIVAGDGPAFEILETFSRADGTSTEGWLRRECTCSRTALGR